MNLTVMLRRAQSQTWRVLLDDQTSGACYLCLVSWSLGWGFACGVGGREPWRWRLVSCVDWEKTDTTVPSIDRLCIKLILHHHETALKSALCIATGGLTIISCVVSNRPKIGSLSHRRTQTSGQEAGFE